MYGITVEFNRFEDVSFADVMRGTGVYVIWDSQARVKPSYIGIGDLLSRLSSHDSNFAFPVRGYIALIGNTRRKRENIDAVIVEALLLDVAKQTDRWPTHNKKSGNISRVQKVFEKHGLVRITIKGCDPFGPPKMLRRLNVPKLIWYGQEYDGTIYRGIFLELSKTHCEINSDLLLPSSRHRFQWSCSSTHLRCFLRGNVKSDEYVS